MTRMEDLMQNLPPGFTVDTYSPGDGVTRYRFFMGECDYFAGSGMYTALGLKEAGVFARGLAAGYYAQKEEEVK